MRLSCASLIEPRPTFGHWKNFAFYFDPAQNVGIAMFPMLTFIKVPDAGLRTGSETHPIAAFNTAKNQNT